MDKICRRIPTTVHIILLSLTLFLLAWVQIYFNISHFLPWLASFLYAFLGPIGLAVVLVLGGMLTAVTQE